MTADLHRDPRRWITLAIVLLSTLIVVLDNTVLNVALPTILRDFHTTLPSLEWVITGYALTFATFLIIGGRLGDLYGTRRVFIVGAALFGLGSLLASVSTSVPMLVLGEALIEGLGASLMLPAALAVLSTTFSGHERATAFAAWGAVAGSAAGLGPLLGGFLTTNFSWRWSFRINVIIAPIAIIGALLFIARTPRRETREPIDGVGAALIASGMFLLVFGLSEGGTYGWLRPIAALRAGTLVLWPASAPVSVVPAAFAVASTILVIFYRYERRRESRDEGPLFQLGLLNYPTFRYGLLTTLVLSMGQLGLILSLVLFLQESLRLSALENGLWLLPFGLLILLAAPAGGRLTRRIDTIVVVRIGLVTQTLGMLAIGLAVTPGVTFLRLLPGLVGYGIGAGLSMSQLTSVVLSQIPADRSGVASGTNTTLRQVGNALGIAVIGTIVTTGTTSNAISRLRQTTALPSDVRRQAIVQIHSFGASFRPSSRFSAGHARVLQTIVSHAVAAASRQAIFFGVAVVGAGTVLSLLIPHIPIDHSRPGQPDLLDEAEVIPAEAQPTVH